MLLDTAKRYIPHPIKVSLRNRHKQYVLHSCLRRLNQLAPEIAAKDHQLLDRLIWSWSNAGWSGDAEYLSAAIGLTVPGSLSILECGTGLTTILIGMASRGNGTKLYSLEHLPEWSAKIRKVLARYELDNVHVLNAPIVTHGTYSWYDVRSCEFPQAGFDAVVCDGPPSDTPGGRYGLMPVMGRRLRPGCAILLDDIERLEEQAVVRRWQTEFGVTATPMSEDGSFVKLVVASDPVS
ncbi:MAG: class I SAM-dependent methyltransferase [Pseudomonadales bacterium]